MRVTLLFSGLEIPRSVLVLQLLVRFHVLRGGVAPVGELFSQLPLLLSSVAEPYETWKSIFLFIILIIFGSFGTTLSFESEYVAESELRDSGLGDELPTCWWCTYPLPTVVND